MSNPIKSLNIIRAAILLSTSIYGVSNLHADITLLQDGNIPNSTNVSPVTWVVGDLDRDPSLMPGTTTLSSGALSVEDRVTSAELLSSSDSFTVNLLASDNWVTPDIEGNFNAAEFSDYVFGRGKYTTNRADAGIYFFRNQFSVGSSTIDGTQEALVITINTDSLSLPFSLDDIEFALASGDDSTDFIVWDSDTGSFIDFQNARVSGLSIGSYELTSGDLVVLATASDNTDNFRVSNITFDVRSHSDLGGLKNYTYTGYGDFGVGETLPIEVYSPDGHSASDQLPCFVFFHGGGWSGGSLSQGRGICQYLASRGIVALTAEYTLTPRDQFPAGESRKRHAVMDAKTVVRWVKQNATTLGIDPNKLVTGGISAGGHISVLQMMDESVTNPTDDTSISTDVQGFVLMTPAFTLLERDREAEVNVFNHIEKDFPPTLFIVGENDNWEPASESLALELVDRCQQVEYWMGKELGHNFILQNHSKTPTYLRVDAFLRSIGILEEQPTLTLGPDDLPLGFVYWGDGCDGSTVFSGSDLMPTGSGDLAYRFQRPIERTEVIYTVQVSERLEPSNWIDISPNTEIVETMEGQETVLVSDLIQASAPAGVNNPQRSFYRNKIEIDPAVAYTPTP